MMKLINVLILKPIRAVAEEKWIRRRSFIYGQAKRALVAKVGSWDFSIGSFHSQVIDLS
jgi:hypothetical protein